MARCPRPRSLRPTGGTLGSDSTEVRGSLDRAVIRTPIRRRIDEVRCCYQHGLSRAPSLAGRVTAALVIGPTGAVQPAESAGWTLSGPRATEVAERIVGRTWMSRAPAGAGIVAVDDPFVFTSSP